ncbi:MAG: aldo/keto reductase [Gemmatimonadetes bacterium]|nr:aldo/keto reductase [Gemmatimonadota bacterium]MCH8144771.1 aldo/keto reductase [Gemmatimonadota bacterium]MCH8254085.1 aldo/keto reductase [Gemmatimonadota bacterium]
MMTPTNRREFLAQLSSFGVLLSRPFPMRAQDAIPLRVIPATGESIPVIGFGSTKAVVQIPEAGTDPLRSVMRMLVEYGGRVVDTGPRSEEIDSQFGRLLNEPELRDKLFLATKINTRGREAGIQQMRQAQLTFGRRTMDLIQIQSLTDLEVHWPNLREWKDTGEARYIGVTVSSYNDYERLEAFMRSEPLDFVHLNYSVVETRAEERLLPLAQDRGMAVLINRPFMNGSFFQLVSGRELPEWAADFDCATWAQFSLKYILAHPTVTCVLTETTNPEHMEENIQAAFGRLPDESTKLWMREVVQGI